VTKAHAVAEILWVWLPILRVGDAIDELDVMGALGITVTSSKFGTGLVFAQILTTIGCHLHEVHGTIHATFHRGRIHFHRKPGSMLSIVELHPKNMLLMDAHGLVGDHHPQSSIIPVWRS
jgi:hypothetical protein